MSRMPGPYGGWVTPGVGGTPHGIGWHARQRARGPRLDWKPASDIAAADPLRYPVAAVDPHSGGRNRSPNPKSLAPFGTVTLARPSTRVGFAPGARIARS